MADQKKWFKVWSAILIDPHHANMTLENVGRWTRLGAMIVNSGENGQLKIVPPAKHFLVAMECATLDQAKTLISLLPNVHIEEGQSDNSSFTVIMRNWFKYQVDSTGYERLKRSRYKRREEESRKEEKRKEEKHTAPSGGPYPIPDPKTHPTNCLVLTYKTTKGFAFDDRAWDKANWARSAAAAKTIFEMCKDFESAESCIKDLGAEYDGKGLSWTLETVSRNAGEWLKRNGRINANTSRTGLRMAITEQRTQGQRKEGLENIAIGTIHAPLRNGTDLPNRHEKNDI